MSSLFQEEATFDCCLALKAEASGVRPVVVVTVRRPPTEADLHFLLGALRTMALYMATTTRRSLAPKSQLNGRVLSSLDVDDCLGQGHGLVRLVHCLPRVFKQFTKFIYVLRNMS